MKNRILKYNRYNFLKENNLIKESSEFTDAQLGLSSLVGPGYGFASDPQISAYSDGASPFIDTYTRMSAIVNDINRVMKGLYTTIANTNSQKNIDLFLEDISEYKNLKILRIYQNTSLKLDVFISFDFNEEEFFGVYKSFNNGFKKPKLDSELFTDPRMSYMDKEYYLKLNNYLFKILNNWFIPKEGLYEILTDSLIVNDYLGNKLKISKGSIIEVKKWNMDSDNEPYIILQYKNDK
jgi:hypothetical protein